MNPKKTGQQCLSDSQNRNMYWYKSNTKIINGYKFLKWIQNQLQIQILTFLQPHNQSYNIGMKTLIDNRWNCLLASLMPNKVTGNSFSLHLNILSMWRTLGSSQLEAVVSTDNNALVDMLIIKGELLLPSHKINLDKKWHMKYKKGYIS